MNQLRINFRSTLKNGRVDKINRSSDNSTIRWLQSSLQSIIMKLLCNWDWTIPITGTHDTKPIFVVVKLLNQLSWETLPLLSKTRKKDYRDNWPSSYIYEIATIFHKIIFFYTIETLKCITCWSILQNRMIKMQLIAGFVWTLEEKSRIKIIKTLRNSKLIQVQWTF